MPTVARRPAAQQERQRLQARRLRPPSCSPPASARLRWLTSSASPGLHRQRSWLVVERLPASAPELNRVEGLWSWLKGTQLANLVFPTLQEVVEQAELGIERALAEATACLLVPSPDWILGLMTRQTNTQNPLGVGYVDNHWLTPLAEAVAGAQPDPSAAPAEAVPA